jgi:hypothetical protein
MKTMTALDNWLSVIIWLNHGDSNHILFDYDSNVLIAMNEMKGRCFHNVEIETTNGYIQVTRTKNNKSK